MRRNSSMWGWSAVLLVASLSLPGCAGVKLGKSTEQPQEEGYRHQYNTIAHRLLALEGTVDSVPDEKYRLLDVILTEVVGTRPPGPAPLTGLEAEAYAKEYLQKIDRVLIAHNFVYPPKGLVETLGDALTPHKITPDEVAALGAFGSNGRRVRQIEQNFKANGDFYFIDCDTSAVIYLAVGELIGLPLHMVEIPGHNFIRWRVGERAFNWDTNYGREFGDQRYADLAHIPSSLIDGGVYLSDMNSDALMGYWHGIVAKRLGKMKQYARELAEHRIAVSLYALSGDEKNELAWLLATCPDASIRDSGAAIVIAKEALAIWKNPNWMDTLAAAYAESHQWDEAVQAELKAKELARTQLRSAFSEGSWPDFDVYIAAYQKQRTYVELNADPQQPAKPDIRPALAPLP